MKTKISSISIIGSGNVATHLSQIFYNNQIKIDYILSRNFQHAEELSRKIPDSRSTSSLQDLLASDMILLCVTDDAIEKIAKSFPYKPKLLVHTSGTTSIDVLTPYAKDVAVFYPLQTFSKQRILNEAEIPICVEAKKTETETALLNLGRIFSQDVRVMSSEKRERVHLAAVFVANFTNYLNVEATSILEEKNIDRSILFPLMKEILHKLLENHPKKVQTGPAYRNDVNTMNRHLSLLKDHTTSAKIYKLLSESIYRMRIN